MPSLREPDRQPATTLNDNMVVSDKPTGKDYVLKPKETKIHYTDFRNIYPSQKPFQQPGDFKKKKKRGRPKKAGRPKK